MLDRAWNVLLPPPSSWFVCGPRVLRLRFWLPVRQRNLSYVPRKFIYTIEFLNEFRWCGCHETWLMDYLVKLWWPGLNHEAKELYSNRDGRSGALWLGYGGSDALWLGYGGSSIWWWSILSDGCSFLNSSSGVQGFLSSVEENQDSIAKKRRVITTLGEYMDEPMQKKSLGGEKKRS